MLVLWISYCTGLKLGAAGEGISHIFGQEMMFSHNFATAREILVTRVCWSHLQHCIGCSVNPFTPELIMYILPTF